MSDVGIIIGRFQTPILHDGHLELIAKVSGKHSITCIFLGVAPLAFSKKNPLPFNARRNVILNEFDNIEVYPLEDMPDDKNWSNNLDHLIDLYYPNKTVTLYGGPDSFASHYKGKHTVELLESKKFYSASDTRNNIRNTNLYTNEYMSGMIHVIENQYTRIDTCVDIAVIKDNQVLLGRKKRDGELYRFIGGFIDVKDRDPESAAAREVKEETGGNLILSTMRLVATSFINDWRYAKQTERLLGLFFTTNYIGGTPYPSDDIDFLEWVDINTATVIPEHQHYLVKLKTINE